MLVYAVVSPEVFRPACFEHTGYQDQVALFFRGLQSNAVLLIDPEGSLLDDIEAGIGLLSLKFRQELEIRMAELRKNLREKRRRKSIVRCDPNTCNTARNQSALQRCTRVARASSADTVFLSDEEIRQAEGDSSELPTARMAEYSRSSFEEQRRRYMEDLPPIDQLDPSEFDELIVRATKFSVWLRLFDKQIGKGQNVSNFRRGIERILSLWIANAHFPPQRVEIITAEAECVDEGDSEFVKNRKETRNCECVQAVRDRLLSPLNDKFTQEIDVKVKQDTSRVFHARHLQTQTTILLVERGFDLQNDNGELRRNIVKVDVGAAAHLDECRGLTDSTAG